MKKRLRVFICIALLVIISPLPASPPSLPLFREKIAPEAAAVFIRECYRQNNEKDNKSVIHKMHLKILVHTHGPAKMQTGDCRSLSPGKIKPFGNYFIAVVSVADAVKIARQTAVKSIYILDYPVVPPTSASPRALVSQTSPTVSSCPLITGIIDQHIDPRHPAFYTLPGKKSRILFYFDQTRGNPGTEYAGEVLAPTPSIPPRPGHGWLTSIIAAGDAPMTDADKNPVSFRSVSSIILVNTTGKTGDIFDGVKYIVDKARALKAQCIIFLPFSNHYGPHRGSGIYIKALETLLDHRSLMIVSSGNDRGKNIHWQSPPRRQPGGPLDIPVYIGWNHSLKGTAHGRKKAGVEIWFSKNSRFHASFISPSGKTYGPVKPGEYRIINTGGEGALLVSNSLSHGSGDDRCLLFNVTIQNHAPPPPGASSPGAWFIRMTPVTNNTPVTGSSSARLNGWVTRARGCRVYFDKHNSRPTVSALAFSSKILSVGALEIRPGKRLAAAPYSNYTYTGKGSPGNFFKPDVLINGAIKVRDSRLKYFIAMNGTSSASALMTRLAGYLWQKHPHLTAPDIRTMLKGKAVVIQNHNEHYRWTGKHPYTIVTPAALEKEMQRGKS